MMVTNDEEAVTVYSFLVPGTTPESRRHENFKAARRDILSRFGGEILEGTAERVARSELDAQGRYRRVATGWGDLP